MAITDNLVSVWEFETTAWLDSFGTNHLTGVNAPTSTAGKLGNALTVAAGSTQYLTIPDNASLSLGVAQTFELTAWLKLASGGTSRVAVGKDDGSSHEFDLYFHIGSGKFSLITWDGSGTIFEVFSNTFGAPSANTYYWVSCGWDGPNNRIFLSVNNGAQDTTATTSGARDQTAPVQIGAGGGIGALPWDGQIDQVVLKKSLFTPAERTQLYNGGAGLAWPWTAAAPLRQLASAGAGT